MIRVGDLGQRPFAAAQGVQLVDNRLRIAERYADERVAVAEFDVVDVFVAQPAFAFEQAHQFADIIAVVAADGDEEAGGTFAVYREGAYFGVLRLVQFAPEGQPKQGAEGYLRFVFGQQFVGHGGVVAEAFARHDLLQFVLDALALDGHDVLRRGEALFLDVGLDAALQKAELAHLRRGDEGDGRPLVAGAARAADTVDVAFGILGQGVVDDVGEVADVDAACGHVGGHQNVDLPVAELAQDLFALGLRNVAVESLHGIAALQQAVDQFVRAHLRAAEDDAIEVGRDVDDAGQGIELVAFAHLEVDLVGEVGGQLGRLGPHHFDVAHVGVRQIHDPLGHRGREEQHAPLLGRMAHDLLDILDEAHVEHFVRLVQHEEADGGEIERAAPDVVEHAAGSADHHVGPLGQAPQLFADRGAAVDGRYGEFLFVVVGDQLLGDLQGQFARGHQHDGLYAACAARELLQNRQSVGGRFAGSGLGLGDDVMVACEQERDGELLDGGGALEPLGFDGCEHLR